MTNLWNQISEIADFDKVLRSTFTFANPFSLLSYLLSLSLSHFHPLIYPLSLSQIPFSLSCINYHFLLSRSCANLHFLIKLFLFFQNGEVDTEEFMGGVETACKGKKYHHLAKLLSNMDPSLLRSCKTANILNIKYLLPSDTPTFPRLSSSSLRLSSGPSTLMEMGQLVSEKRQELELEQKHCDSSQENFTLWNTILLYYTTVKFFYKTNLSFLLLSRALVHNVICFY